MRTTKKDVYRRLEFMNKYAKTRLNETYEVSYFGGWDMYLEGSATCSRGKLGFDYRKSTPELMAYIDGVVNALAPMPNLYPQVDFLVGEDIRTIKYLLSLSFREVYEESSTSSVKTYVVKNIINGMTKKYVVEVHYDDKSERITSSNIKPTL